MSTILESLNPASASPIVSTPVKGNVTSMISATASSRGLPMANMAIAMASKRRTTPRSAFMCVPYSVITACKRQRCAAEIQAFQAARFVLVVITFGGEPPAGSYPSGKSRARVGRRFLLRYMPTAADETAAVEKSAGNDKRPRRPAKPIFRKGGFADAIVRRWELTATLIP